MKRAVTLFTGQWANRPLATLAPQAKGFGFDGLELACWGDHFNVAQAAGQEGMAYCKAKWELLQQHDMVSFAVSDHLNGQAVLDHVNECHKPLLEPEVWGDGKPDGVNQRAGERMKLAAVAARNMYEAAPKSAKDAWPKTSIGTPNIVVNGFVGSPIWAKNYSFPPVPQEMIDAGFKLAADRLNPILDVFAEQGVRFALEVHPTELAFDYWTFLRMLEVLNNRAEFGSNLDPSHLLWQGVKPELFARDFGERIFHVHMKDVVVRLDGRSGILGSHLSFGDHRRGWNFRSLGRGDVDFEELIRALNDIGYTGPLSVEWEDSGMDQDHGARESCSFVRQLDFQPSGRAFDAAFDKKEQ